MNHKAHIADLHQKAFTIDAHFDLTYDLSYRRERGEKKVIETNYMTPFREGGFDLVVSAIFVHDYFLPEMGLRKALDQISFLHDEIAESPGQFRLCRTVAEAQAAKADGEVALFLSLEGADPCRMIRAFCAFSMNLGSGDWGLYGAEEIMRQMALSSQT